MSDYMKHDIYLVKDGVQVAICSGYTASPYRDGHKINFGHFYVTAEAIIQDIDVLHMTDFQLVCEKHETVIRYWIKCWDAERSHINEGNGCISGMSAFADHREEHLR